MQQKEHLVADTQKLIRSVMRSAEANAFIAKLAEHLALEDPLSDDLGWARARSSMEVKVMDVLYAALLDNADEFCLEVDEYEY